MKKFRTIWSVLLIAGITSCSNFLNVTPKNVISMDDLESIKQAMSGFLYNIANDGSGSNSLPRSPFESPVYGLVPYTDEWDLSKLAANEFEDYEMQKADWRDEMTQYLWGNYYKPIGFMNLILHEAAIAEGDEAMRDYIMGEAYVMRAYCFFKLVQHFSPYKDNEWGIPVCLETYEDFEEVTVARKTQKEVYTQILSDLHEAELCIGRTAPRTSFNLMYNSSVINRLYAEIYHFKALSAASEADDWKNAVTYAEKETKERILESDPDLLKKIFTPGIYNSNLSSDPECALRVRCTGGGMTFEYYFQNLEPNQIFYETYFPEEENDIRKDLYYKMVEIYDYNIWDYVTKLTIDKFSTYSDSWGYGYGYVHCGFRLAETFLIQAEALAMQDQIEEARIILDRFKSARYKSTYTIPTEKEALLQDIYRERRKEFVAEGDYGWLDMKRLGLKAERTIGGITFKLEGEGDYRYAFPLTQSEIDNNKEIRQNPGWILNN